MKKLYTSLFLFAICAFSVNAQTFFLEDFSGGVPPTGWAVDAHASNWLSGASSVAGGSAPEAQFTWTPQFTGESYLYSAPQDLSGLATVTFSFLHSIDHYGGNYTVGVATRSGGGVWNTVWEMVNPSSTPSEEVEISISNSDVGMPDFEIAFFFSGDSYNINDWYIDNAKLFVPFEHDVATKAILGDTYFDMGDSYIANALVKNGGLSDETFDVLLEIIDATNGDILFTQTQNISLTSGTETTLAFNDYELPFADNAYEIMVKTMLEGDMDTTNDSKSKYIYTYTNERGMVLLEIGTGTWCVYCPGAAMGADDLVENGHNVAVMENHNGDDYTTPDTDARNAYYGISGYPTAVFDGLTAIVGGSNTASMYPNYLPVYEERIQVRSAFNLDLFGESTSPGMYSVTGVIQKDALAMNSNVVLQIGLTESEIAENWQGQTQLNFVTRLLLPDASGTVVDVANNDYIEVNETFMVDDTWVLDHLELVYFLQDNDTKEILQGGKVMVTDLIGVGIQDELAQNGVAIQNIYPNPFSNETNINFSTVASGNVMVSVHDMTGREVAVLANENMTAGDHKLTWEAGNVPNGIYFCTISTADTKITQKVMLSK